MTTSAAHLYTPGQVHEELGFQYRSNPDPNWAYAREQVWQGQYGTLSDPTMRERFRHYEPAKMIAYTFPDAQGPGYDTAVDMSCFFLYLDRIIDDRCWDQPVEARELLQQIGDVLADDTLPEGPRDPAVAMFAQVGGSSAGMSWHWRHRAARNWMDYLWANLTETYQRHTASTPTALVARLSRLTR